MPEPSSRFTQRHNRLSSALYARNLDILALNPGPSLTYLTGLHFHLMERPVVAFFRRNLPPAIVLPELEAGKVSGLPYALEAFPYGEDPNEWLAAFRQAAQVLKLDGMQVGIEPGRLRVLELRFLQAVAESAAFVSAEEALAELRARKDAEEAAHMRQAADIAQRALLATLPQIKIGMTEKELASELVLQILRAGSGPELPFAPIVSAGPNAANPHAAGSLRPLQPGDLLVIDWGASYEDYYSDITRTFAVGEISEEMEQVYQLVKAANRAGREAVHPGVTADQVDAAARQVIEEGGYGKYFIHRTGHGLGMEAHEPPYIRQGNETVLEPGMTFTIEPGIYLPGRNGVRIEDDVLVTDQGSESLTDLPRELETVG